jgi:hypothetical protein
LTVGADDEAAHGVTLQIGQAGVKALDFVGKQ